MWEYECGTESIGESIQVSEFESVVMGPGLWECRGGSGGFECLCGSAGEGV